MNKIHRVIWNVRTGTWVVVAETTHSRGKGGGRAVGKALLVALISSGLGIESALADQPATTVIPASGKTKAYISANGVPVVNIDTANTSGLSHNRYTRYDVEANGLVLNNGNNSQIARQSQLAGQVTSNLNLVKEAAVILNEVVSVNRSTLAGFTEVLGGKADVIVANPYGITCDGCGFINTDRATLTTGTSSIGADGSLTGFNVKSGDVLIGAKGANATAQQILDIVTRSVKVEGNINTSPTGKLGITTGNNSWNYGSRNTTGTVAADGAAPSYAIDSTALGGMYAGRIRIIATEAGVGVRMLGEAAASADDFTISSAGKVEIQSAISAARDVAISSTSTSGSGDVFVKGLDAKISAGHDLDISATSGQVKLSEGELYAANNIAVTADTLSDVSTTDKARYAEADNTLVASGEASIDDSVWGAGKALSGTFDSLSVGANGATIHAGTTVDLNTTNVLALANAAVRSTGDMALASSAGTISSTSGVDQGIQTTNGNLSLTAGNGLNNAGKITSDTGSVTARIDGTLNNSGELHAKTTLDIADKVNTGTGNITNSGTLIADGNISVNAASVNNQIGATVQGTTGTTVTATELINAGTFIASDTAGQSGNFTLSSLNNSGTLQSKEDLVLNVIDTLDNTGKLLATQDLSVNAGMSALAISNTNSGIIQAGGRLSIAGANATFGTQSGTVLGNTTDIILSRLDNSGTLQSNANMALAIGNGLVNSGTLLAKTTLSSNSGSLTNSGTLQANQGSTIGTSALSNTGGIIASDSSSAGAILNVATLSNTGAGVIQSAQNLAINVSGSSLTNANTIIAARDLSLTSTGAGATVTNQNGGFIQAGSTNGDTLTIGGTAVSLNNNSGANILADQLVLSLSSLTNAGLIQGGAGLSTLVASGAVDNSGTLTLATGGTGTSNITANSLDNSGTLQSAAEIALVISNLINNLGTLFSTEDLTTNSGSLTNSGTLQTNQSATITTGALANSGQLIASGSSSQTGTLNVSTLSNTGGGVIQSAQNLVVNLSGARLTNASKIIANNDLMLMSTGSGLAVTDQSGGYLQAGSAIGDTLTIGGNNVALTTLSGSYILGDELAFTLASLSNAGVIQGGAATSTINVSGNVVNSGTLTLADTNTGSGTITANSINNTGTLQSQGDAALNVATSVHNSGQLLTGSGLSVRGTDSYYTVSNTGRIQSGGLLDVKGLGGGSGVDITVGSSGVMLGNTVGITANNLNINNGAMLTSLGAMRVGSDTLTFGGSSSKIVGNTSGGATTSITLANGFNNTGAIHSGGILDFNAPWIYNTPTGGFSALDTLNLNATGGPVDNSGALYAGIQLNASATGTFTNYSTGTIDSNGSLNLIAGTTFTNNNRINALQDITIVSTSFNNVITGGVPSRSWGVVSWDPCTGSCNGSWTITSTTGSFGWPNDAWQYYKKWGSQTQSFSSSIPPTKPQIIANRNMTISGFTSAVNGGGVLAANSGTLTIAGTGTFTNDDLSLESKAWTQTATQYQDCGLVSCDAGVITYDDPASASSAQPNPYTAGIYANTLVATGFGLVNRGSPWATSTTTLTASGSASTSLTNSTDGTGGVTGSSMTGASSGTSGGSAASGITTTDGAPAVSFSGLVIALPTNPNGYFVISQDSNSTYLIEANPLFAVGSNFVGSDYMANRYGYNPDTVIKRLGDSNYEAYLIQQQLISQTGNNIIKGYGNEADQMKRLMDQAVTEGESAGFVFGEALTSSQIANLESDVVWMVETTVAGQKVLAPVVYLSAATRDSIETGAVIAGNNVEMNLTTVSNTGGTISGVNSLNITAQGDITNTSGTIKGGDVSIKSIEGSIENKTLVSGSGGAENYATSIGKTAGIEATGDLDLDAKKDITVLGAEVKAGGDASLAAGGNVTFDTIIDKTTDTKHSSSSNGLQTTTTSNTTTTEKNIGSTLVSGGNLKIKSGGDTTIAGSNATVGGDLSVDAGGDFNVLSRQDKTTSKTVTETSGLGVGGGVAGTEKITTDDFKGTNSGSTLTVGGNATVKADKSMTVQGSDVTIAGDADINAKEGINILDGLDETRTNTVTETTTYMKIGSAGESDSGSDSSSDSQSGPGRANATASAEASAEASGTSDIKFAETTKTSTQAGTNTSVSSNFKVGGNLKATTEGTIKVQGSNVESGGDMELDAKNVEVLTGRNEEWTNTQTVRTSVGIYNEGEANTEAGADAQAKAGTVGTNASASANASAEASGTTTIGARTENEETTDYSLTNSSSTLKSGGSMSIKAKETAVFVGAEVESGGDMNIEATDIVNKAAEDITLKTSSKETNTAGLYIDGEVSAEAGAEADAGKIHVGGDPANGEAGGKVSADASAGLRFKNEKESSIEGSVTNVTTSFKSGGDFTRNAENTIVDQGTQIEAGGDIIQSAREIKEIEANDSTFSSKGSSSHDAKIGVGASASAEASGNAKGETESDAGAGAGLRAKYEGSIDSESEGSTTAVTTKYKSGGSINSKSKEKTTLIGTQFESGGDINIQAGSLEYKAAKDTTSMSSDANKIDAALKVDVVGKAGGSLEASYGNEGESGSTSTARTGSINAGGNLTIKTKDDASFEGTNIEAGGKADIAAGGNVDFKAARDTAESSKSTIDASVELSSSKGSKGVAASGGYSQEDSSSSTAQAGSIKAGSGGINISAGKDVSFEGTKLKSDGDTTVDAGGNVNLKAAKSTATTTSFGVEGSIDAEKGSEGSKKEGSISGNAAYANKIDSDATSIDSGGKVSIKGKNVVNQEANIIAKDEKEIIGKEVKIKAEKSDISIGIEAAVSDESETEKSTEKKAGE